MAQRAYWPWEKELEDRTCFPPFLLFLFSPTTASNSDTILMTAENTLRWKGSNYPFVSSLSWIRLLVLEESWRGHKVDDGQRWAGQSLQQKSYSQHRHFCFLHLHYKLLAALIAKHHRCIFPKCNLLVTYYLPIDWFLEYIFFKCHTQWATGILLKLIGNSLCSLLFPSCRTTAYSSKINSSLTQFYCKWSCCKTTDRLPNLTGNFTWPPTSLPFQLEDKKPHFLNSPLLDSSLSCQADEGWKAQTLWDTEFTSFKVPSSPPLPVRRH